ncbi:Alpha-tocopherol transfer protein-like [Papilio machaon]|uniref:Alpha-tocopherol transfer protein-like n=1 Tax=Papilio machaon TaxID=76193 RepID=A0A194R1G6_PAPMA|nr:Alpha-tocopherol transfer protein-like [Papilio machaon]
MDTQRNQITNKMKQSERRNGGKRKVMQSSVYCGLILQRNRRKKRKETVKLFKKKKQYKVIKTSLPHRLPQCPDLCRPHPVHSRNLDQVIGRVKRMASATLVQPSGELWKKIRVELNEDVNTRDQDLAAIKEWLRKQPHLPDEWDDDRMMTFLRGCSFSLEKCKRKLDMYFTMRTACPEFFTNRDITRPELNSLMNRLYATPLPGLTPNGRRVSVARGIDKNLDTSELCNLFKIGLMIGDVRLREEEQGVGGDVYILDAAVLTPKHLAKLSPALVKKFLICVQISAECSREEHPAYKAEGGPYPEAYPVKLKEVHVVNASPIVDKLVTIIKPFLKEKIKNRVNIYNTKNTLIQHHHQLTKRPLSGARNLPQVRDAWMKKLENYTEWFKKQESIKANESLRPGKPTNYDELFGIDGSFRQLSID